MIHLHFLVTYTGVQTGRLGFDPSFLKSQFNRTQLFQSDELILLQELHTMFSLNCWEATICFIRWIGFNLTHSLRVRGGRKAEESIWRVGGVIGGFSPGTKKHKLECSHNVQYIKLHIWVISLYKVTLVCRIYCFTHSSPMGWVYPHACALK